MIVRVTKQNVADAAKIHALSWQESHRAFCTPDFIAAHSAEKQTAFLLDEIAQGKHVFMLIEDRPVGVVSVWNDMIENLYILPGEQRRGYGTKLLNFALTRCVGMPTLWILDNNAGARRLYEKHGFRLTGRRNRITDTLSEEEMSLTWTRPAGEPTT